jgi:hypothetical protein
MRALAALRMVWARRRLGNGGGDLVVGILATWCVRKLRGDARAAALSLYRELSMAPGMRVWRARRRRMVIVNDAPKIIKSG